MNKKDESFNILVAACCFSLLIEELETKDVNGNRTLEIEQISLDMIKDKMSVVPQERVDELTSNLTAGDVEDIGNAVLEVFAKGRLYVRIYISTYLERLVSQ